MPAATAIGPDRIDALGIKDADSEEQHNPLHVESPIGLNGGTKNTLRESVNGANGVLRSSLDERLQDGSEREKEVQDGDKNMPSKPSVNGWQESENNNYKPSLNGWTEVKGRGSVRSKPPTKKRSVDDIAPAAQKDSTSPSKESVDMAKVSKLSPDKLIELASSPEALPLQSPRALAAETPSVRNRAASTNITSAVEAEDDFDLQQRAGTAQDNVPTSVEGHSSLRSPLLPPDKGTPSQRPSIGGRTSSTPLMKGRVSNSKAKEITPISIPKLRQSRNVLDPLHGRDPIGERRSSKPEDILRSPISHSIPVPPLSVPTHLHLELSSHRPSPLYLYRSPDYDFPYEPLQVKLERLQNFFFLPPQLELVLWFGTLACFDAWLYTFTILPIRFGKAMSSLVSSWARNLSAEATFLSHFVYAGMGRMWQRWTAKPQRASNEPSSHNDRTPDQAKGKRRASSAAGRAVDEMSTGKYTQPSSSKSRTSRAHRRTRSEPSNLLPIEKADILKGLLIITSCYILMYFDASMMYHNIRGQAAIKLYVIYNALEVSPLSHSQQQANHSRFLTGCSQPSARTS